MMGGGLTSCGLFLSSFARGVLHLIITHGLITGEYVPMDGCSHALLLKCMQVCM